MLEQIKAIQKTLHSTSAVVRTLMESGEFKGPNDAFVVLRACLKGLRDRISPGEVPHLGSHLPALLRGFYFEGWRPVAEPSRTRTRQDFLEDIRLHLGGHEEINLERVVPVTMKCIMDLIDQGEAVQILHNLPREMRDLCP